MDGWEEETEKVKKKVRYSIIISTGDGPVFSAVTHTLTPSHDAPPTGRQDRNKPVRPNIIARYQQKVRQSHEQIQQLREILKQVRGQCIYYFITQESSNARYYIFQYAAAGCPNIQAEY